MKIVGKCQKIDVIILIPVANLTRCWTPKKNRERPFEDITGFPLALEKLEKFFQSEVFYHSGKIMLDKNVFH